MQKKSNKITFLKKGEDFKIFPSKSGEQVLLLFVDTGEMATVSIIELNRLLGYCLKKQAKLKKAS